MKVIAINGSPRKGGNCAQLLEAMGEVFTSQEIEFETIQIGNKSIRGCMACYKCVEMLNETCIYKDEVNKIIPLLKEADGIVLASPVYFAGISGTMKSFLDRLFLVSSVNGNPFRHKVGGSIVSIRRSGATATLDSLNHYLMFSEMWVASGNYWAAGHGRNPGEVQEDLEGLQATRLLAKNMAWMIKSQKQTENTLPPPIAEEKEWTHFIR